MRLALQTLAVLASGTLLGVGANSLSPRPLTLGAEVRARAQSPGLCAAPPPVATAGFDPAPPPVFGPAPPAAALFLPVGPAAAPGAAPEPCHDCSLPATLFAGGAGACGTCHAVPRSTEVVR